MTASGAPRRTGTPTRSPASSDVACIGASSGTVVFDTVATVAGLQVDSALTQTGGTLTLNGTSELTTLTLAGGAIDGSGDLTVTATFTWTAGMLTGAGTFTLATGATGTFTTTSSKEEARDFINNSVIAWDAGVLDLRTDNPTNETTFTNNGFLAVDLSQSSLTMQWGSAAHTDRRSCRTPPTKAP